MMRSRVIIGFYKSELYYYYSCLMEQKMSVKIIDKCLLIKCTKFQKIPRNE